VAFTSERSTHRRIYQPGVFHFHRIDHAFLPPSVSKQSITSFPQCPGANESPPAELTTFSARVNVMPFSIIINGHRVDKGPRIRVESTHSSKRRINRGFSLVVEFKFDFIDPYLIDRRFFSRCESCRPIESAPIRDFSSNTISSKALISRIATAAHLHPHLHFQRGKC